MVVQQRMARADVAQRLGEALLEALGLAVGEALADVLPLGEPAVQAEPLAWLSVEEVCRRLDLSRTSVEALMRAGGPLTPIHEGRSVKVASDQLLAYQLAKKRAAAGGTPAGESEPPIDIGRTRRRKGAASSAARHPIPRPRDSGAHNRA